MNLSFGCLHWTVQTESANCAESFSLRLPHGKMLTITLLFISFAYQCQAVYSATRAPYVAQMTHFKSPYFNLCTFSLPLAVRTATTFGAVTNGKLNVDHMMANLSRGSIKWASLISSCAEWLSSGWLRYAPLQKQASDQWKIFRLKFNVKIEILVLKWYLKNYSSCVVFINDLN